MSELKPTPQIGPRLRDIRKSRKLTLEDVCSRSGVAVSVISELERSKGNPTFATLWSITRALGIELSDLTDEASEVVNTGLDVQQAHFTPEIKNRDNNCTLRILGPTNLVGQMEWYELEIAPGGELASSPHKADTWEHLTARKGQFEVTSDDATAVVGPGDTVRYRADKPHSIKNAGDGPATALLVVIST